jgi:uncharacterized membrane protein
MSQGAVRHVYLDRVRGLAVLIMIEAHVLDSWTRASDRTHPGFGYAMMLGGMGAPLFLFLAGVAVVLSAHSKLRKSGDAGGAWRAVQRRGWEIFGLAFLFRLQSFILGGGHNAAGLLKVDILNIMGPAIVVAAAAGALAPRNASRAALFAILAAAVAMVTPIVRVTPLLSWLPDPLEWYFRPVPGRTNFTLFPWSGFVFAGAVAGMVIDQARHADRAVRVHLALGAAAAAIVLLSYEASFLPSIYARSEFWTSSPTFFFLRVGLMLALLALAFLTERYAGRHPEGLGSSAKPRFQPVALMGKSSLFVYWVHVELVYGVFSRPFRGSLSFNQVIVAYALFTLVMLALVVAKNRVGQALSN